MGTADVCTGAGANPPADGTHVSLPDTLSARPGDTTMLLDGRAQGKVTFKHHTTVFCGKPWPGQRALREQASYRFNGLRYSNR